MILMIILWVLEQLQKNNNNDLFDNLIYYILYDLIKDNLNPMFLCAVNETDIIEIGRD